jgi:hypothetical protein
MEGRWPSACLSHPNELNDGDPQLPPYGPYAPAPAVVFGRMYAACRRAIMIKTMAVPSKVRVLERKNM